MNPSPSIGTSGSIGVEKICGIVFSADASKTGAAAGTTAVVETACSYKIPFRVGVHFDTAEALAAPGIVEHSISETQMKDHNVAYVSSHMP